MRYLRSLVAAATLLALGLIAPSVSASPGHTFHLDKTCDSAVLCTIWTADFKPFVPGTDVTYTFDDSDPWDGLAFPRIAVKNGSTTGVCDWNQPGPTVLAVCTFDSGTGRLAAFHLAVDVTVTGNPNAADSVWHWDGAYWYGR